MHVIKYEKVFCTEQEKKGHKNKDRNVLFS